MRPPPAGVSSPADELGSEPQRPVGLPVPPVRAPARAARTLAGRRPAGLLPLARHRARAGAPPDLAGHADAPPRRRRRQLLPRREGGRRRVHRRGRGGAGAVRGPGRRRGRQRPHAPRRAAGAGRPRCPGRDLPGRGRRARRPRRPSGVAQPRGAADRREPADPRPSDRAAPGGNHLPPRRRARRCR